MHQKYGRLMVVFAVGALLAAAGDNYTWTNARGDGDWTQPGNFIEGAVQTPTGEETVAIVCPGADDEVFLPVNAAVTLEYDTSDPVKKASCEAFAAVKAIRPYAGAVIDITVPGNTTFPLACSLARGTAESNYNMGHLVKRGAGELVLNAAGTIFSGSDYHDYYCEMTVDEGVVRVVPNAVTAYIHLGKVTINENGTLFTANTVGNVSDSYTVFKYLYGSGTITNDSTSSAQRMKVDSYGDFSGRITGNIYYYSAGFLRLTGTESTIPSFTVYHNYGHGFAEKYGSIEVAKFGMKPVDGVNTPSSIGYEDVLLVRDNGAAIRYIGHGETTDKDLRYWPQQTAYPLYLDGGPYGDLHWTGLWGHRDTSSTYQYTMLRLILQGSNTQDCVMSGPIEMRTKNGTNYTFCITKQGTGTWYMKHNDSSRMLGVWRVVNGTLKYDTIAEAGVNSALGSSTMLYKDLGGVLALDENKVDYAFWLGGGAGGNRSNLEYVGETNCISTTRRFVVNGTGALLNNGAGRLRIADFIATNTAATLVLGGSNMLENVADCIADGENATMSVVKEGIGTWRLGTNCTFTGALDVKAGRLLVGNDELYNYYRWIVKENFWGSDTRSGSSNQMFGLLSFGLFDADGNDRTYGVTDEGEWTQPGSYYVGTAYNYQDFAPEDLGLLGIGEGRVRITKYNGESLTLSRSPSTVMADLFSHQAAGGDKYVWSREGGSLPPWHATPSTWIAFTIRPVKGAPITSWDFANAKGNGKAYQFVKMCELQASVDGKQWDSLANLDYDGYGEEYYPPVNTWRSDNTTVYQAGYTTHTTGMPIPPGPTNAVAFAASSVSVAAGAELVARAPEKPVIRTLTVDGLAGGGTIDGFALASDLTLAIDNVGSASGLTIPMTFRNVEGLDASGWKVSVGGKVKAGMRVRASSSELTITPPGIQFIIR